MRNVVLALTFAVLAAGWRLLPVEHGPLWADVGISVFAAVLVGCWYGRPKAPEPRPTVNVRWHPIDLRTEEWQDAVSKGERTINDYRKAQNP